MIIIIYLYANVAGRCMNVEEGVSAYHRGDSRDASSAATSVDKF